MTDSTPLVIIPAYNEAENLPQVLGDLAQAQLDCQVLVVDDGSRDATAAVARHFGARVVSHPFNLGYGTALQTGYKYALDRGTSILVQMDADGQHNPRDIPRMIGPIERDESDIIVGSRFLEPNPYRMGFPRELGRQVFRALARLAGLSLTDPTSGLQAMNRRVLTLYATDFYPSDYPDVDVLLTAHRHGLRVRECPVTMSKGLRESSLHGGARAAYYAYKMLLSIWVASAQHGTVETKEWHNDQRR